MFISKKKISRRTVLRGAMGTAVALPLLEAMVPAGVAQSKTAAGATLRFGGVYVPNGVLPDVWHPKETGSGFTFTRPMKSLEPYRKQVVTVSGMTGSGTPGPHLGASAGWLNGLGAQGAKETIVSGKTLDQYIVDRVGGDTPLPSMEIGTEDMGTSIGACDGFSCVYFNCLAWRSDTAPLPVEINPRMTFERMFGETGSASERRAKLEYKRSMLDSIMDEVGHMRTQLGANDNQILSSYLDNVREVERRIQQVEKRSNVEAGTTAPPSGIPASFDEHMELSYDLLHLAFQGDITRVFTFLTGVEASNRGYSFIGVPESHHVCSHHGNSPEAMEKYTKIVTYQVEQFARFVQKLASTPDGDGTLFDHSLLYFGGGMSNGNVHDRFNPAVLIAGGANGRLKGDNHVIVPNRAPTANLLLSLAEIADIRLDHIGPSNGKVDL